MIVGGRLFEWTRQQVQVAMRLVDPEQPRKHVVEIGDKQFPPKQVLAVVTGWERQSFTTLEAQRVLSKLGFPCHPVGTRYSRETAFVDPEQSRERISDRERLAVVEAALATAQEAIASLRSRVAVLEGPAHHRA